MTMTTIEEEHTTTQANTAHELFGGRYAPRGHITARYIFYAIFFFLGTCITLMLAIL